MGELAKIESFRRDLAVAETINEIQLIKNAADAFSEFARKEKMSIEGQNELGKFRIEITEKIGQWLNEHFPHGVRSDRRVQTTQTLPDKMPITPYESARSRTILETPRELKQQIFEQFKNEGKVITPQAVYIEIKKPHISNNSGEYEWYTPEYIIESARLVMGTIDTDPASSEIANRIVKAKYFFTKEANGLDKNWTGNVWLNPPYGQPYISNFSEAIVNKRGQYNQAIILVNNATETEWFQRMLTISDGICLFKTRIKFIINGSPSGSPLQGQAAIYFGNNANEFFNEFGKYGICLSVVR
jgi:ParB family chromosome partitioning protein